ncbi:MAG: membrane-bound O-acyltransferase family protein, partial [Pikeienuella sp.]
TLTMVLGGLWHGANWTFLAWGAWHGLWLAIERKMGAKSAASVWPRAIAWPVTMGLVLIGWVLFRAETLAQAGAVYGGMLGLNGWAVSAEQAWQIQTTEVLALLIGGIISTQGAYLTRLIAGVSHTAHVIGGTALFLAATTALIAQSHSPFLYFQF